MRASAGIPVIGEVELAARFLKGHIVAITGSNGKTTTTTLAGDIIAAGGRKTLVGGNIGTPAITFVDRATDDTWLVLEISSFQLETVETFHPQIAVVLNITPDHLDRHHTFENYAAAKARIFENQTASDFAVLNADNEPCAALAAEAKAAVYWFSRLEEVERGAFVRGDHIVWRDKQGDARDHAAERDLAEGRAQRGERAGGRVRRNAGRNSSRNRFAARSPSSKRSSIAWNMWPRSAASSTTTTPRRRTSTRPSRRWSRFPAAFT